MENNTENNTENNMENKRKEIKLINDFEKLDHAMIVIKGCKECDDMLTKLDFLRQEFKIDSNINIKIYKVDTDNKFLNMDGHINFYFCKNFKFNEFNLYTGTHLGIDNIFHFKCIKN